MKKHLLVLIAGTLLLLAAGCVAEKLPSEDLDVLTVCKPEIEVLHSKAYPANSKEKFLAARSLLRKVDFTYTRRVETLDAIFSSLDAHVDRPNARDQVLNFYYQYQNRSIRFVFYRHDNVVTRFEVIEN